MYFSPYKVKNNTRTMQSTFYGLNKNARIGDGEFADMLNMSGDHAPLLSPRQPRVIAQKAPTKTVEEVIVTEETAVDGTVTETETTITKEVKYNLNGVLGDVGFAAVWGGDFYYMGSKVEGITLDDGEKKLVAMGADILIFPDGVYYNTATGENGSMETGKTHEGTLVISDIVLDDGRKLGDELEVRYHSINASTGESDRPMYFYFGTVTAGTKISKMTVEGVSRYLIPARVKDGYIEYLYEANCARTTAKCTYSSLISWRQLPVKSIHFAETPETSSNNLWANGERVHISGNVLTLETAGYIGGALTDFAYESTSTKKVVANYRWTGRNFPVFDAVCVHDNRLWGCRNGIQVSGTEAVNEIYCSKLGDFKTWTLSSETATLAGDPYTMSVGEYGAFTGCISHRGQLLFFKDNIVYRVTGDKPTNFRIEKISESGLQKGCERSLEIIDEVLYYKSRNGVFAYDGSIPQKISDALGNFYYTDAVAGKHFSKYYITMVTGGVRKLYVYDTRTGLWHAEDDADIRFFTEYNGALYGAIDNDVVCLSGTPAGIFGATEAEPCVKWSIETGDIGLGSPYQKFLRRLLIRMDMDDNAKVLVELLGDDGEWYVAMKYMSPHKRTFLMPVVTPRVDHARIRISGVGGVKIYSVSYETESAGDRYVESWSQQESARERGAYSDERAVTRDEFLGDSAKT